MREHDLKTWPEYFQQIEAGSKTFEIRKNDRNFRVGDRLLLREWNDNIRRYAGKSIKVLVTSILDDVRFGLKTGYVVMSIKKADGARALSVGRRGPLRIMERQREIAIKRRASTI